MSVCPKCNKEFDTSSAKFINGELICAECAKPIPVPESEIEDDELKCAKCGSRNVVAQKKGYGAGSGCCGAIIFGPLGLLCGAMNANKMELHCLKCGNKWDAGNK